MPSATIVKRAVEMREVPASSTQEIPTMAASGVCKLRADSREGAADVEDNEVDEVEVLKFIEWDKIDAAASIFMIGSPSASIPEIIGSGVEEAGVAVTVVDFASSFEPDIFLSSARVTSFFALPIKDVTEGVCTAMLLSCCTKR